MEELIPIASKLQDVLGALGQATTLDFPQIVVVGGQSSGKSSVLESIVGRSFLPRGQGIVTRRPLVLQLFTTEDEEWGEFLHHPGKIWKNFSEIRSEIVEDTERLTGTNRGIHSSPIHLKIFSPRVLANLTLVDLPGMAKVAVGDQPTDIAEQIRAINLTYIQNPNAIILAVTCANTDLANSDALQLAKLVDPDGDRTVGVLTKLDLMDPGTHAVDVLHNRVIPLRRYGHVAVVNRGQRDVDADLSVQLGQQKEAQFFRLHPVYAHDKSLKLGTPVLVKMLNSILLHHLRNCLPELKSRISVMMADVQSELDALGEPTDDNDVSRSQLNSSLLTLLSKFTANFASTLDGSHYTHPSSKTLPATPASTAKSSIPQQELSGGARIAYIFHNVFSSSLLKVNAFDGLTEQEIRTTITNANGTRQALFVPEISFDILVRKQISRLEQPGLQCVDFVYEELQRIASQCEPSELTRFPNLRDSLLQVVNNLLKTAVQPTQLMVSNLVKIELAYINTSHPDFIGGSNAVAHLLEKIAAQKNSQSTKQFQQTPLDSTTNDNTSNINSMETNIKRQNKSLTPISSPSLDHYLNNNNNNDDTNIENTRQYHDTVPDEKQLGGNYGYQTQSTDASSSIGSNAGGIMNFIFRGNNTGINSTPNNTSSSVLAPKTPNNRNNSRLPNIVQLPQVPDTLVQSSSLSTTPDRESMETEIIKSLLDSYFQIVRKNFIDMVPKTIMYFLVNHVRHAMQNELVSELYGKDDHQLQTLMKEAEDVAMRRKTCVEMKDLLSKALEIVNEVRDYNSFQ